jgi:hypothetical protein
VAAGDGWFVNWADFPSVVPVAGDLWAAHWLVKSGPQTYAYDVAVALSQDRGVTWSEPLAPHTDGTPTEHGFVSLFPWADGVGALWLDGRNMAPDADSAGGPDHDMAGHGTHSSQDGMTLRFAAIGTNRTLASEVLVDERVCDCCQTDVAMGPDGPIAVYRNRTADEIRDIYVARAVDGRWQPGRPVADDGWHIAGCPVNGPAVAAVGDAVAVAWYTAAEGLGRVRVAFSADGARTFGAPIDLDRSEPLGRVAVVMLASGDAVVSWMRPHDRSRLEIVAQRVSAAGALGPLRSIARTGAGRPSGFPQLAVADGQMVFAWTDTTEPLTRLRAARLPFEAL